ncbi:unnamed protein product, partial [Trichogramma brassicae]
MDDYVKNKLKSYGLEKYIEAFEASAPARSSLHPDSNQPRSIAGSQRRHQASDITGSQRLQAAVGRKQYEYDYACVIYLLNDVIRMSASELFQFTNHFGILIGDYIPINDPAWNVVEYCVAQDSGSSDLPSFATRGFIPAHLSHIHSLNAFMRCRITLATEHTPVASSAGPRAQRARPLRARRATIVEWRLREPRQPWGESIHEMAARARDSKPPKPHVMRHLINAFREEWVTLCA